MTQLFTNNASSTLAVALAAAATTLTIAAGDGGKFPNPQAGDDFLITVFQRLGTSEQNWEIMLCTSRAGDVLTVARAQEGTTARAYGPGDFVECRLTAGAILPARGGALTGAVNEAATVTIASAAAVAIGAAKANTINITGTTAITAFDAAPIGAFRRTVFADALTLTYNAVSMVLLGNANIVTAAGDVAEWISMGSGQWRMSAYSRRSGDSVGTVSVAHGGTGATDAPTARGNLGLGNVENKSSATIRGELTNANVVSALGYAPTTSGGFAVAGVSSVVAETVNLRVVANPTSGVGYGQGVRFRFANANDIDTSAGYADVIDLSTYNGASGGGFNSLYFNKNSQSITHKYAPPGATSWTVKQLAYIGDALPLTGGILTGQLAVPSIQMNRITGPGGISWYSSTYSAWTDYMAPTGAGQGPNSNITAPSGALVTGWAKRSYIESTAGYGWTFESAANNGNPVVVAEISSADGSARFGGNIQAGKSIITKMGDSFYPITTIANDAALPIEAAEVTVPWGTPAFVPLARQKTLINGAGYRQNLVLGTYRDGINGYGGGFFVGLGNTDATPNQHFLFNVGGDITHSSGYTFLNSGNVGTYAVKTPGGNSILYNGDLNSLQSTGFYIGNSLGNAPVTGWLYVTVEANGGSWLKQTATTMGSGAGLPGHTYVRQCIAGNWMAWATVWTSNQVDFGVTAAASTAVRRDANGYIQGTYVYMTDDSPGGAGNGGKSSAPVTAIMVKQGDDYYRGVRADLVRNFLNIGTMSNQTLPDQVDLNTFLTPGIYTVIGHPVNGPSAAGDYGSLTVAGAPGSDVQTQIYVDYNTGRACSRGSYGNGAHWSPWRAAAWTDGDTLTKPTIQGYFEKVSNLTGSGYTVDIAQGTLIVLTTNSNTALYLPPPADGMSFTVIVNYGGAHTITFGLNGGTLKWAGGAAPSATSTAGKADKYIFTCANGVFYAQDGGRNF